MIRLAAAVLALLLAIAAGIVVPTIISARGALPTNDWYGLRYYAPVEGTSASCALGAATATAGGSSVWAAVTGWASLDIIQVGARISPNGQRRYFAAWGRGEPGAAGSLYQEADLGPADAGLHRYRVELSGGTWSLWIDGHVRLTVADTFRTWAISWAMVAHETEALPDPFGGTRRYPARCESARMRTGEWVRPLWNLMVVGRKASAARANVGPDYFRVWRP